MTQRPIVIIGFMGSGKTAVGMAVARKLDCDAIDLDELIPRHEKRTPSEIIEQDGEAAFRVVETRTLREFLQRPTARVLAVGGGAWTISENRKLIAAQDALVVWLDASFELCWSRIEVGPARPLAPSHDVAKELYGQRRSVYELAEFRVIVEPHDTIEMLATKVAALLTAGSGGAERPPRL